MSHSTADGWIEAQSRTGQALQVFRDYFQGGWIVEEDDTEEEEEEPVLQLRIKFLVLYIHELLRLIPQLHYLFLLVSSSFVPERSVYQMHKLPWSQNK